MFRPASHDHERLPTAIYTRQSRARSSDLTSCAAQRWICDDFCREHGFSVVSDVFDDEGESSETLDRPALQRLLKAVEAREIGRVVVYGIDRLTRKLLHLAQLLETFERLGVALSVVTDPNFGESAVNRLTSNIIAAASEFQLEITRERLADARTALKRKGRRVAGRVPFGYRANSITKQLVVEPAEAVVVRQIFSWADSGKRPQQIADQLNETSSDLSKGTWTARRILKLLANPIYTGAIRHGSSTLPGCHEALVEPEAAERIQKIVQSRRSRDPGRSKPLWGWSLQGILICDQCGRAMSPSISGYKNFRYSYYRCRSRALGRPPCKDVGVSAYELEKFTCNTLNTEFQAFAGADVGAELRAFASAWLTLSERQQVRSLANVVREIRYNATAETISLTLAEDALVRLSAGLNPPIAG